MQSHERPGPAVADGPPDAPEDPEPGTITMVIRLTEEQWRMLAEVCAERERRDPDEG